VKADALADAIGDPGVKSLAISTGGVIQVLTGDVTTGLAACRRGLDLSPDPLTIAVARGNLGWALLETGDAEPAIALLEQAASQTSCFRYPQTTAWLTALLGEAHLLKGDVDTAHVVATRGLDMSAHANHRHGVAVARRALGRVARAKGAPSEARRNLEDARSIFASIPARFELGRTLLDLAALSGVEGRRDSAIAQLHEAHEIFRVLGLPDYMAHSTELARKLGALL
jgi:tetratricopeptide (TPR) repeat protein